MTFAISTLKTTLLHHETGHKENKILRIVNKFSRLNGAYFFGNPTEKNYLCLRISDFNSSDGTDSRGSASDVGTRLFGHACGF